MEEKSNLEELKENYKEIQEEYGLPDFEELNEDFQIERTAEIETDSLIREIRKFIAEKSSNYLRFTEAILHPTNAPMFVFSIIKTLGDEDRKILTEVYKRLAKNEVSLIKLDIKFDEQKEADFIKNSYKIWQETKRDILKVIESIEKNWDNKVEVNGKGYFG